MMLVVANQRRRGDLASLIIFRYVLLGLQGYRYLNTGNGRIREVECSNYVLAEFVGILKKAKSHYAPAAVCHVVKVWTASSC